MQAAPFSLLDQNGLQNSLENILSETPNGVIVVFFASTFLRGDRDLLQNCQVFVEHNPQIPLIALCGANWESQQKLAQELQLSFPVLFDACCRQANKFGAMWIPKFVNGRAVFQLDATGRIVYASNSVTPLESHPFSKISP